jgi:uncharacterized protein (TIGR00661 family)
MTKQKRILVAPLNWGLGHATRCVPIIRALLQQNACVVIGGDGMALAYLKAEFPNLKSISIPDLKIQYPKSGGYLLYFALRLPKLFAQVKKENRLLKKLVRQHEIDGIISDNRYGLYHAQKPSALITHQLFIETTSFKKTVHAIVGKLIQKFTVCWVPDDAEENNLSGRLSHSQKVNPKVIFVGLLSRFQVSENKKDIQRKVIAVLSGPEPFRTQLETLLIDELTKLKGKSLIVRGVIAEKNEKVRVNNHVNTIDYLAEKELLRETLQSELVIARSGYSSIMDLVALHQKAILIPTPQQTEQEYLAKHLHKHSLFVFVEQDELNLRKAFAELDAKPQSEPNRSAAESNFLQIFLKSC